MIGKKKMIRINPVVTEDAKVIYDSWPPKQKHYYVSQAILEKHNRDNNKDGLTDQQRDEVIEIIKEYEAGGHR